ncbi:dymeclin [Anaeramoeba flamelloides]|uniref:Dymeclin n=1 Tax=Anaeramoeba flamelloides TaxID=1746091 RepID=A0AAV7YBR4_9EUKA|nr:dymeclin [Anaeramoeba flamelloides]
MSELFKTCQPLEKLCSKSKIAPEDSFWEEELGNLFEIALPTISEPELWTSIRSEQYVCISNNNPETHNFSNLLLFVHKKIQNLTNNFSQEKKNNTEILKIVNLLCLTRLLSGIIFEKDTLSVRNLQKDSDLFSPRQTDSYNNQFEKNKKSKSQPNTPLKKQRKNKTKLKGSNSTNTTPVSTKKNKIKKKKKRKRKRKRD